MRGVWAGPLSNRHNDGAGPGAGDDCLRQVAAALRRKLGRPSDLVARYGGEEFAVILPGTGEVGARYVAERLRLAVLDLNLPHADNQGGLVTISVGVRTFHPGASGVHAPGDLLTQADALLYQAKAGGRNRVCGDLDGYDPAAASFAV